jgi:PAS domain S-box-containing protein
MGSGGDEHQNAAELIRKLQHSEHARRALESQLVALAERERLLEELQTHQHELEAQNETLRQSQRDLQESHARYLDLYDSAPIPYCTFDRKGVVLEVNLPGAEMLGQPRALIIGQPFLAMRDVKERGRLWLHIEECLAAQGPVTCELTLLIGQNVRELQLRSTAVRSHSRPPETCRTAFLDITDRRAAERQATAAHAREHALRTRLEGIDRASAAASTALASISGVDVRDFLQVIAEEARAMVDADYAALGVATVAGESFDPWVFSGMNAADAAAIGRAPRAVGVLGAVVSGAQPIRVRDLRDHAPPVSLPAHHPVIKSFIGVPIRYQGQSRGHLYLANERTGEFTADDQLLIEMLAERVSVAMEIARLRQFEASEHANAKLSADRLTSAFESIEDALALYDANARLVLCNSAYRASIGRHVPDAPLVGESYHRILEAWQAELDLNTAEERALLTAWDGWEWNGAQGARRFELRTRDGRSLRMINRRTPEGGIVQVVRDLTDDVRRERDLAEARYAAESASAAKSDYLSSMSHELRTPLNAILGFAQLLQRDKKLAHDEQYRLRVGHILKGGEHLLCLIDDLLELSRIESGRLGISLERVQLDDLLADVGTTLDAMAEHAQVELRLQLPPASSTVIADRTRLKQILVNFGSNAIKYGRVGGHVEIRAATHGRSVRLAVTDDGIGIAPDKQARIFLPFERAGQEAGPIDGTGIGLAISKRLAEVMQGSIGFRSEQGRGSEFWVELPVYDPGSGSV